MYILKAILSPRSRSLHENRVDTILSETRVNGNVALHPQYLKMFIRELSKAEDETKCLNLLISKLESLSSIEEIIKLFTIIHSLLIDNNYQGVILFCI
jgi:hypothetical protein